MEVSGEMMILVILMLSVFYLVYKEHTEDPFSDPLQGGIAPGPNQFNGSADPPPLGGGYTDEYMNPPEGDYDLQPELGLDNAVIEPALGEEQELMNLVSSVKESCDQCALSGGCSPECQNTRPICEKLMGVGHYPDIPCPTGGVTDGNPIPFDLYGVGGL